MKNSYFVGDLKKDTGRFTEVNTNNYRYESYKLDHVEGEKFIVGEGKPGFLEGEMKIKIEDINLLLSLINLVKEDGLPERYYAADPSINELDSVILDEDVLRWVEKYGIPYRDQELNKLLGDEVWRFQYLHLNSFKRSIALLYARFSIWKATMEDDLPILRKFSRHSLLTLDYRERHSSNFTEWDTLVKLSLAEEVGTWAKVETGLMFDSKTDKYIFTISVDSLLSLGYYQLATLMTKPETGKKLKHCDYCNDRFWPRYGKEKYCPNCNRKTVWSRRRK